MLGVHYWYVKIPQFGYIDHPISSRQATTSARISETSVIWASWNLNSPSNWLFAQQVGQAKNKEFHITGAL